MKEMRGERLFTEEDMKINSRKNENEHIIIPTYLKWGRLVLQKLQVNNVTEINLQDNIK